MFCNLICTKTKTAHYPKQWKYWKKRNLKILRCIWSNFRRFRQIFKFLDFQIFKILFNQKGKFSSSFQLMMANNQTSKQASRCEVCASKSLLNIFNNYFLKISKQISLLSFNEKMCILSLSLSEDCHNNENFHSFLP